MDYEPIKPIDCPIIGKPMVPTVFPYDGNGYEYKPIDRNVYPKEGD